MFADITTFETILNSKHFWSQALESKDHVTCPLEEERGRCDLCSVTSLVALAQVPGCIIHSFSPDYPHCIFQSSSLTVYAVFSIPHQCPHCTSSTCPCYFLHPPAAYTVSANLHTDPLTTYSASPTLSPDSMSSPFPHCPHRLIHLCTLSTNVCSPGGQSHKPKTTYSLLPCSFPSLSEG